MGARMRERDWAKTPLGSPTQWQQSLKTAVRIMLTSRQAMFVWWGEELINLYNDAYKAIVGGKHPEALGQPASYVWREIWDQVGPRAESAILKNEGTYDEALLLIMERNGYPEETYYTFSYSPVPNDEGGTGGIICANTDDTQRIIGERQLALLRELAAKTADARTFDEACTLSAECLKTNRHDLPFAMIYLGDPEQQRVFLTGTSGIDRTHVAAPETVDLNTDSVWSFAEVLKTQKTVVISDLAATFDRLPTGAWDRVPHQAVAVPIAPSGQTGRAGILIVGLNPYRLFDDSYQGFIDLVAAQIAASIANAQAYEEERKRAEALAELDRAKTVFFSNVSHEFRTPLTLMLGPLEDLLTHQKEALSVGGREQLETVHRNSLRLLKLVNTLLDFSRIEAGRIQAVYEPTDLSAFTTELASVFRSAIERARMQLIVDCPSLPESIYVDREMWEKIVFNLLSNAFKFTFEGEIAISLRWMDNHVELAVQDTGTGIPAEEIPHLFERFHRVPGARGRTYEGSGIGLSLVQELVKLHGGTISVTSEVDRGTRFVVSIPTGSAHLPSHQINATRTLGSTATGASPYVEEALRWLPEGDGEVGRWGDGEIENNSISSPPHPLTLSPSSARILLADDNADMRDYVKRLLSQHYEVETVADGMAALEAVRRQRPNLVLTDVMMPRLDGFGLLRELRADPTTKEIPIILLSARAGEESRVEGLEAGADDYLIKPFAARELLARVEANLKLTQIRQEATAALREAQIQLESALVAGAVYTWRWNIPEERLMVNAAFAQLFAVDPIEAAKGLPLEVFVNAIHEEDRSQVSAAIDRAIASGEEYVAEYRVRTATGEERWLFARGQVEYDSAGNPVAFPGALADITDRKRAEVEREQLLARAQAAREAAEAANRVKDEFLAVLSHELRSPLNPILGWSKLLQTRKLDEAKTAQALSTIERNAKLQAELIEDLLDVSRILQGKLNLNVRPVNLATTIQSALETVRLAAQAKSIEVDVSLDPQVGRVSGDTTRLQQVVWNLLSNAVKFTSAGDRVMVRLEQVDTQAQITVRDTGKGIHPDFLSHVFDYFRQEDGKTTRQFGGLGLGLAIVRHLVELHGGTVSADSPGVGLGSTFTVQLPLMAASLEVQQSKPLAANITNLSQLQILVVDDEADMRELALTILEEYGAVVRVAASATEALMALAQFKLDVLICDIGMPDVDGYMLMRQIRSRSPEQGRGIPAVALTAYAGELNQQQALAAGFQLHISKPVEPAELAKAIATLVGRSGDV
ncbi:response regulator [Microcoleus sp. FACHB-SPT15]|uniref:ATP-binding protein n=1 Tax=Microcoleus sp. FACHB-SPT15 TaxID=2692830 RepID=UPI001780FF67|nr:ATP-binding protein [Microcoleus sp. FACHB-SPT15]MBD1806859.1 response regulator [Microcoleus sp. FACHB-SPT15]